MKKKKFNWGVVLLFLGSLAVGALVGLKLGEVIARDNTSFPQMLLELAFYMLLMILANFLHIAIHESGHLVFGLLTGYGFSSFRLGSLMLVKENGKLRLGFFKLAGTGGQCLMTPPELVDGWMPFVLYNLGGCIFNLVAAGLALLVSLLIPQGAMSVFLLFVAVMGLVQALANGLPLRMGLIQNDGKNALELYRYPSALRAFWAQLQISEALAQGKRAKDMPQEWFWMPQGEELANPSSASAGVMHCNRLMDEHRFEEAREAMEALMAENVNILELHRRALSCDLIYCELIGQRRWDVVEGLMTKEQKNFMQAMRTNITVLRTQYLLALHHEKDEGKAANFLAQFEKQARNYPYRSEVEAERELIAIAGERRAISDGV